MGYYIKNLNKNSTPVSEYIGSQTIYSSADNGAYDSPVSNELQDIADKDESIIAIVDATGVKHFLNVMKNNINIYGRDKDKLISIVEEKLLDGFKIIR